MKPVRTDTLQQAYTHKMEPSRRAEHDCASSLHKQGHKEEGSVETTKGLLTHRNKASDDLENLVDADDMYSKTSAKKVASAPAVKTDLDDLQPDPMTSAGDRTLPLKENNNGPLKTEVDLSNRKVGNGQKEGGLTDPSSKTSDQSLANLQHETDAADKKIRRVFQFYHVENPVDGYSIYRDDGACPSDEVREEKRGANSSEYQQVMEEELGSNLHDSCDSEEGENNSYHESESMKEKKKAKKKVTFNSELIDESIRRPQKSKDCEKAQKPKSILFVSDKTSHHSESNGFTRTEEMFDAIREVIEKTSANHLTEEYKKKLAKVEGMKVHVESRVQSLDRMLKKLKMSLCSTSQERKKTLKTIVATENLLRSLKLLQGKLNKATDPSQCGAHENSASTYAKKIDELSKLERKFLDSIQVVERHFNEAGETTNAIFFTKNGETETSALFEQMQLLPEQREQTKHSQGPAVEASGKGTLPNQAVAKDALAAATKALEAATKVVPEKNSQFTEDKLPVHSVTFTDNKNEAPLSSELKSSEVISITGLQSKAPHVKDNLPPRKDGGNSKPGATTTHGERFVAYGQKSVLTFSTSNDSENLCSFNNRLTNSETDVTKSSESSSNGSIGSNTNSSENEPLSNSDSNIVVSHKSMKCIKIQVKQNSCQSVEKNQVDDDVDYPSIEVIEEDKNNENREEDVIQVENCSAFESKRSKRKTKKKKKKIEPYLANAHEGLRVLMQRNPLANANTNATNNPPQSNHRQSWPRVYPTQRRQFVTPTNLDRCSSSKVTKAAATQKNPLFDLSNYAKHFASTSFIPTQDKGGPDANKTPKTEMGQGLQPPHRGNRSKPILTLGASSGILSMGSSLVNNQSIPDNSIAESYKDVEEILGSLTSKSDIAEAKYTDYLLQGCASKSNNELQEGEAVAPSTMTTITTNHSQHHFHIVETSDYEGGEEGGCDKHGFEIISSSMVSKPSTRSSSFSEENPTEKATFSNFFWLPNNVSSMFA